MLIVPLTLLDPLASWELCLIAILSAFSVIAARAYARAEYSEARVRMAQWLAGPARYF
jgi:hypothetical protein